MKNYEPNDNIMYYVIELLDMYYYYIYQNLPKMALKVWFWGQNVGKVEFFRSKSSLGMKNNGPNDQVCDTRPSSDDWNSSV